MPDPLTNPDTFRLIGAAIVAVLAVPALYLSWRQMRAVTCGDCRRTMAAVETITMRAPWGTSHRCHDCDRAFWAAQEDETGPIPLRLK